MNRFRSGADVQATLEFFSVIGVATSYIYKVINKEGVTLLPPSASVNIGSSDKQISVSIPAAINDITERHDVRIVQFDIVSASGTKSLDYIYALDSNQELVVPTESLVSYYMATFFASGLSQIDHWEQATKEIRVSALIAASRTLAKCRFRVSNESLQSVSPASWDAYPKEFREAIIQAVIIQADSDIRNYREDSYETLRRAGVSQKTTGQTSITFRTSGLSGGAVSSKSLDTRARSYIGKYIIPKQIRLGRG